MAAGGTFTVQNKVRPGVYFRFRSKNKQDRPSATAALLRSVNLCIGVRRPK